MKIKNLTAILIAIMLNASMVAPVFAANVDTAGGTGDASMTLLVNDDGSGTTPEDPVVFSATIPTELPIVMGVDGTVNVPKDAQIRNNVKEKQIAVTSIAVAIESGWTAADYADDFTAKPDDSKSLALKLRSDTLQPDSSFPITENDWVIDKDAALDLNMDVKIPQQTVKGDQGKLATISFTLDWAMEDTDPTPDPAPAETAQITFTTDGNGTLEGNTVVEIEKGQPISFPTPKPVNLSRTFGQWVDTATNAPVTESLVVQSDMTIQAEFPAKAASPKNWFVASGNTVTGLSDEYLNMENAPADLVIPSNLGGSTITTIGENALANKDLITSVIIPNTVTSIGSGAFKACSGLSRIYIPESVTSIAADSFSGCSGVTSAEVNKSKNHIDNALWGLDEGSVEWKTPSPDWDTAPMTSVQAKAKGFEYDDTYNRLKITQLTTNIPTSLNGQKITSVFGKTDMPCKSLIFPETVEIIAGFSRLKGCEEIVFPDSLKSINDFAFGNSEGLKRIRFGSGLESMPKDMFSTSTFNPDLKVEVAEGCKILPLLLGAFYDGKELPDSIVDMKGFSGATAPISKLPANLQSIENLKSCTITADFKLPDGLKTLGYQAFDKSVFKSKVLIVPAGVTKITAYTFKEVSGLETVIFEGNVTSINAQASSSYKTSVKRMCFRGTCPMSFVGDGITIINNYTGDGSEF